MNADRGGMDVTLTATVQMLPDEFNLLDYWLKVGSHTATGGAKPAKQDFYGRKQCAPNTIAPLYTHLKLDELSTTTGRGGYVRKFMFLFFIHLIHQLFFQKKARKLKYREQVLRQIRHHQLAKEQSQLYI